LLQPARISPADSVLEHSSCGGARTGRRDGGASSSPVALRPTAREAEREGEEPRNEE